MAFAMTWKPWGATHLEGNKKKMGTEVDGVRHDPPTSHVHNSTLMVSVMGFER